MFTELLKKKSMDDVTETGNRREGASRWDWGSFCLMETVSVWEDDKVLEMDGGGRCTTMSTDGTFHVICLLPLLKI